MFRWVIFMITFLCVCVCVCVCVFMCLHVQHGFVIIW